MIPVLELKQTEKNKLVANMNKILNYFNEKKNIRKKINEINSKMLINKQIIEEIKRRRDEGYLMYKDQITNLTESVTKKSSLVKQFQKKFSEVEIFIQRECQNDENIEKYGKWKTFTVIPFMKKNEEILKRKCFYEEQVNNKKNNLEKLEKENMLLKENNENNKINNNKNDMNEINNINKLNKLDNNNIINEKNDKDELSKIKEYYDKVIDLNNRENELMKCRLNFISDINTKKAIIPTFKSKNPISNLDINLNLFDPKEDDKNNDRNDGQELPHKVLLKKKF